MRSTTTILLLLAATALLHCVHADEPTITSTDTMMEFKIGGAKLTIDSSQSCASSATPPLVATVSAVQAAASQLQVSLSSAVQSGAAATVSAVSAAAATNAADTSTLSAQTSQASAFVASLRAVAGLGLENLAMTASVNASSSSIAARMTAIAQAQTTTASRAAASVTAGNALLAAGANASAATAGAYVSTLKAAVGASFTNLVTQATIDTAVQSIRTANTARLTVSATAAVSAATSAVVSQGVAFAAAAQQAGQVVALASTIRAKTGAAMENLPGATYASTTLASTQTVLSNAVAAQASAAAQITVTLTAAAVNATVVATNSVAQGLAYVAAYRTTAGGNLQNVATTTVLTNSLNQMTADISNIVTQQQAATATASPLAISTALNSLSPLVTGQGARVTLGETRVSNLTVVTQANNQSVILNTVDISNGRSAIASFSTRLTTLASTRTTTSVNSSSFISGVNQQLANEILRAIAAETAIQTTESQMALTLVGTPVNDITNCQNLGLVVGSTTLHTCVDLTLANCNANTATRLRLIGSVVEYCDGTAWIGILNTIGLTAPQFGTSCQAIYTTQGANPTSGTYYIGTSSADATPIYCLMRPDGGWAMIAMMSDVDDETWQFVSPVWTDTQLLNPDVTDPNSDLHMKNSFYLTKSFTRIRFHLSSIDTFPFVVVTTQSSAQNMFLTGSNIMGTGTAPTRGNFQNTCNNPRALETQANCNQWGINSYTSTGAARFGMQFNEQGDCSSCDSAIGVGIYLNSATSAASGSYSRIGSGFITFSPNTRFSRRAWIFIQ